ncbi:hypothetical protein HYT53_01970 [Candidatus Woesearchaeota archaeon]|nr:hypothetical protein [Candidatus Woesearchaeota archaeon]MBI4156839.1 hypothetical protein [Candidatus Woesearchaeota archaeon]
MTNLVEYSYEKVNYLLRLKKQIERKLIIEALLHLSASIKIEIDKYHYIGFGSVYFADFIMFHKYLNINKMTSIENKKDDKIRFKFNKPFDFVKLNICDSQEYFQRFAPWNDKLFVWLDYDKEIDESMISDVEIISSHAKANDFLLVTIEGESPSSLEALKNFKTKYQQYLPGEVMLKDIKDFPKMLNSILITSIQNGLRNQIEEIAYIPMFNLSYKDTKRMYTFGVIFCKELDIGILKKELSNFYFCRNTQEILDIDCPIISLKEKMHIDSLIKQDKKLRSNPSKKIGIKTEVLKKYCIYYKYYPQFFESIY